MVRIVLFVILFIFIARMFWRIVDNVIEAASGRPPRRSGGAPGAKMVRDPVCGTFVLPDQARSLGDGGARVYFCSDACRAKYRPKTGAA